MKKSVGIIGAGNIGQTVARHLIKAGYPVILSNSRGPDSLKEIVTALGGARAGTVEEAAKADIVFLSLPWSKIPTIINLIHWTDQDRNRCNQSFYFACAHLSVSRLGRTYFFSGRIRSSSWGTYSESIQHPLF